MQETRSINCCGCGAGLPNTSLNTVKCEYCGSFNKILDDGKTVKCSTSNNKVLGMSRGGMIALGLAGVILPALMGYSMLKILKK